MIYLICGSFFGCTGPPKEVEEPAAMYRPHKLFYENSSGEQAITTYYYDREGENYRAHWQLADSSRSSMNFHEFDTMGNLVRKYRIFSDGITSDQFFKFDSAGLLSGQDFSRSDGVTGSTVYSYDEKGNAIMADCRGLNGWFYGQIIYKYENGMKSGAALIQDSDTIGFIRYGYDQDMLVYEYWDFNGEWNQTFQYDFRAASPVSHTSSNVFIRESPWFWIVEEYYDYNGETGGPSYYRYDEENRLAGKEFIRSDGMSTATAFEYDSTGMLRYSHRSYSDGDTALFHYWYGINRELLVRTWERSDGSRGSETYRYDDNGRLTEGVYENMDEWLNGNLGFTYDDSGILTGANFAGQDGFGARLFFTYDMDFNLVGIRWEFSYGGTQTYIFKYAYCC